MGVYATWSPHWLNPIGLSKVQIVEHTQEGILVEGVDLVDGTPILDIKKFDSSDVPWEICRMPNWLENTK